MGVLKANVSGVWTPVGAGGEVYVGADDPGMAYDLWYDSDDPGFDISKVAQVEVGTWTPTLGGMVVGTGGTNQATYLFVGGSNVGDYGLLWATGQIIFGTSGQTFPTSPTISLPSGFNFATSTGNRNAIPVEIEDTGTRFIVGWGNRASLSTVGFGYPIVSGSILGYANITPTVPMTWAAGDAIRWTIPGLGAVRT